MTRVFPSFAAIDRATIEELPQGAGWPRGWWRQPSSWRVGCCHGGVRHEHEGPRQVPPGWLVFLTGVDGEVYCEQHAPWDAPKLEGGSA